MTRLGVAVLVAAVAAGCSAQTSGEACEEFAGAFCGRIITCGALSSADRTDCVYNVLSGCCTGPDCQDDVADPGKVDRCVTAIDALSCTTINQWAANPTATNAPVPAICRGVAAPK